MRTRSRLKCTAFAAGAVTLSLLLGLMALLGIDVFLHHKFERGVLFNVWGYRGPVVGRKMPGEYRVAVLGGSAAYGFGVRWDESMPALLEQQLAMRPRRFSVVNLAYNNEGAYSFLFTLKDYAYLRADLVVLYSGYNDLMGDPDRPENVPNRSVFRHQSPVFRLTGYMPVFPIIFREKASVLLYGDTRAAYPLADGSPRTVFRPGLATRTTAGLLQSAADVGDALERQLGRLSEPPRATPEPSSGCRYPWAEYCQSISAAISWALDHHQQVLVVTEPYLLGPAGRARHADQQRALAEMLRERFAQNARVRYLNLGTIVDLSDPSLSFDRMHLTPTGNARIARALVQPVTEMAAQATAH